MRAVRVRRARLAAARARAASDRSSVFATREEALRQRTPAAGRGGDVPGRGLEFPLHDRLLGRHGLLLRKGRARPPLHAALLRRDLGVPQTPPPAGFRAVHSGGLPRPRGLAKGAPHRRVAGNPGGRPGRAERGTANRVARGGEEKGLGRGDRFLPRSAAGGALLSLGPEELVFRARVATAHARVHLRGLPRRLRGRGRRPGVPGRFVMFVPGAHRAGLQHPGGAGPGPDRFPTL